MILNTGFVPVFFGSSGLDTEILTVVESLTECRYFVIIPILETDNSST